jgi:hypothetical protein
MIRAASTVPLAAGEKTSPLTFISLLAVAARQDLGSGNPQFGYRIVYDAAVLIHWRAPTY